MKENTQLLATFTNYKQLNNTIKNIKEKYNILYNKIFILKSLINNSYILTYNIEFNNNLNPENIVNNTIEIHRKKNTNTLYTINALNYLISLLNDGKIDLNFKIPWENYKNLLLITNKNELIKIKTQLYKIITF